jgi:hypothetical protein
MFGTAGGRSVSVLLTKLLLAPAFVVGVSAIARRYGPRIGGIVGGLPVVAGPILLVLAMEHGAVFAADASRSSMVALSGLAAFAVWCARVPSTVPAWATVLTGWGVFLVVGTVVAAAALPIATGLAATVAVFAAALRWGIPNRGPAAHPASRPPHDLAVRAAAAMVMVVGVTSASVLVGAAWSGVLAAFPVVTSVLAGFSLAHDPRLHTQTLLRSILIGMFSFAAFLATVSTTLVPWGIPAAFGTAVAVTVVMQAAMLHAARRALNVGAPTT